MTYSIGHLTTAIKEARQAKQLTQAELGKKVGLPQSHISKIESGRVDLSLSSLIELARALDLEVTLAPRKFTPTIQALVRSAGRDLGKQQPKYQLTDEEDNNDG